MQHQEEQYILKIGEFPANPSHHYGGGLLSQKTRGEETSVLGGKPVAVSKVSGAFHCVAAGSVGASLRATAAHRHPPIPVG